VSQGTEGGEGTQAPPVSEDEVRSGSSFATTTSASLPEVTPVVPRAGRALRRGCGGASDYVGTVLVSSVVWICLAALLGAGGIGLVGRVIVGRGTGSLLLATLGGAAAAGIGTGPVTLALFDHVRLLLVHEDVPWWRWLSGVAEVWQRGLTLAAVQVAVGLILTVDALYFIGQASRLMHLIGIAFLYPLFFWLGAVLIQWPLAVERPAEPLLLILKKSLLLFLDNLGYMTLIGGTVAAITVLCVSVRMVGLVLAWAGTLAFVQTAALRELLPKYDLLPPETDEVDGELEK
jgi:uncharacterized membrane protein YesL